jgi:transcriptional regulator with XRE-family HTH domain
MAHSLGKRVAKNVKALRLAKGMSQQDLANKSKLTVRYISRLENTSPNVTLDVIERLIQSLNCAPLDLIGDDSEISQKIPTKSLDETIRFLQGLRSRL